MAKPAFLKSKLLWLSLLGGVAVFLLIIVAGENEENLIYQNVGFEHNGTMLSGVLISPATADTPTPCVVFVHGAGDVPRDNYGYYQTYWNLFARKGWCSFSWDKPGVGASDGNWKNQSLEDRASEVAAAVQFLRTLPEVSQSPIGLIGFSQAGWVMPKVPRLRNDIAFIISVAGATNWMDQARFSGEMRMKAQGLSDAQIAVVQQFGGKIDDAIKSGAPYQTYLELMAGAPQGEDTVMSEEYWQFVLRNWRADVRDDLASINIPVLAIFGTHDAYVDPVITAREYQQELERSPAPFFEVITFENADHGLMLTDTIAPAHKGVRAWLLGLKIWFGGEDIFPQKYLATLENWLDRFSNGATPDE